MNLPQTNRSNDVKLKGNEGVRMIVCKEKNVDWPFCLANINAQKNGKLWVDVGLLNVNLTSGVCR